MTPPRQSYRWRGAWLPVEEAPVGDPLCADSWLHEAGRTNGLVLHRARYERTAGPLPEKFWAEMFDILDRPERLFPRVSLNPLGSSTYHHLDVRPSPPARVTTVLSVGAGADPRTLPTVKGPDLSRLADYRRTHTAEGADDAIVCSPDGSFAETTTGALVGWEDGALIVPRGVHLPSVTQAQVTRRARALGIDVRPGRLNPAVPLWFLNSLHGISPVSAVFDAAAGTAHTPPAHPDAAEWAAWWWAGFAAEAV